MKLQKLFAVLAITWVLAASGVRAQEQPPQNGNNPSTDSTQPVAPLPPQQDNQDNTDNRQTPAPAARGLFLSLNPQDQTAEQIQPDTHVLSGAVTPGLGFDQATRRLFDPAFQFTEGMNSGIILGHNESVTSIGGTFAFDQRWKRSRFSAVYSGSENFYEPDTSLSQAYHNVSVAEEIHWSRWGLLLRDDLFVSPDALFGGFYMGAPGVPGQNSILTGIDPSLQISATILTGPSTQVNNTSLAEIDYSISRRTTLTFVGSYGVLHFSNSGFFDDHAINASAGYNYALSAKNTVGLIYEYSTVHFNFGAGQETHLVGLAFGRKVTQRLSFKLTGGPQVLLSRNLGISNNRSWGWALSGFLNYQATRNTSYMMSYFHGVTAGSGVYLGAISDTFNASVSHRFTRFWSATVNSGYTRSSDVASTIGTSPYYDSWFAGASLSRQVGREILIIGSYGYQRQYSATGTCPVPGCGLFGAGGNIASISLAWHPFAIQNE